MPLEKNEQAVVLLVNVSTPMSSARVSTLYPQAINASSGIPFHRECGSLKLDGAAVSAGDPTLARALEDAAVFFRTLNPADPVHMENCSVGTEARPDSRVSVVLGPLNHFGETFPVRFLS